VIPERIGRLLEAQERFDARRARAARLGPRLVDLSYANFDGPLDPAVRGVLQDALASERSLALQYTPFGGSRLARRAVADRLAGDTGLSFSWRDVVLTSGAAAALTLALRAVGEPGDQVVVPTPCWIDHPLYVEACGKTAVLVPLPERTGFDLDVDALQATVGPRTTALLLGHPANPTGRAKGVEVVGGRDALGGRGRIGGRELAPLRQLAQLAVQVGERGRDPVRVDVVKQDGMPRQRGHLSDPGAHRPGSDHADRRIGRDPRYRRAGPGTATGGAPGAPSPPDPPPTRAPPQHGPRQRPQLDPAATETTSRDLRLDSG